MIKIHKKDDREVDICYICYVTFKTKLLIVIILTVYSVNPLYLIIYEMIGLFEGKNKIQHLVLDDEDEKTKF